MNMNQEAKKFLSAMIRANRGKRKVTETIIFDAFKKSFPESYYPDIDYQRLQFLLEALEKYGKIKLPKGDQYWNKTMIPTLPRWIMLVEEKKPLQKKWKSYPWCPELSWISNARKLSEPRYRDLIKLNNFFISKNHIESSLLPIKERSIKIFSDEKKIDDLIQWDLFAKNISLEQMLCYKTVHPFPAKTFCQVKNHRTIIIENRDTFDSLWRVNQLLETPVYRNIIYGHGKAIEEWILWLNDFDNHVKTIEYFGDIDQEGLYIPYRLNKKLEENHFTQRVEPSLPFYSRLIELYKQAHQDTQIKKLNPRKYLILFPYEEQLFIENLLSLGKRIAQELMDKTEIQRILEKNASGESIGQFHTS